MYIGFLLAIVFLFLPGFALVRAFSIRMSLPLSVSMAPVVSAAYYGVLGILYSYIGITSSPFTMLVPAAALLIIELILHIRKGRCHILSDWGTVGAIALYAAVGTCIGWYVFVRSLPSYSGMVEQYDAIFHANLVRRFIATGDFSCMGIDIGTLDSPFYGSSTTGFYPVAWHEVVALVTMSDNMASTMMAMNAVNWAYCSVVFPVGILGLFMVLFKDDRQTILIGSIVPVAFTAFPWRDLLWGPIFPNLASFCSAPAVALAFLVLFSPMAEVKDRGKLLAAGIMGIIGLGMLQPNAVFAVAVFVVFYIMHVMNSPEGYRCLPQHSKDRQYSAFSRRLQSLLLLVACIAVWTLLYRSSFMQGVVSYSAWVSYTTAAQSFINILVQAYMKGMNYYTFPQLCLAAIVLLGIAVALLRRETRWLIVPYGFFCIAFIINVSTDGFLKRYLTGFWYSDPNRIAAICAIMAMPLAAIGLSVICTWAHAVISRYSDLPEKLHGPLSALLTAAVFLLMNFYPNYIDPENSAAVTTAFGEIRSQYATAYAKTAPYSEAEEAFVQECLSILPPDAIVINDPSDGSVAAYGFDGLNVVYNQIETGLRASDSEDSPESQLIRTSLVNIGSDAAVQKAVADTAARYVILLSKDDGNTSVTEHFVSEQWSGISGIDDETPGFKLLLADGDMRLYEIEE